MAQTARTEVYHGHGSATQSTDGLQLTTEILAMIIECFIQSQPDCDEIVRKWSNNSFDACKALPLPTVKSLQVLTRVSRAFYLAVSPYLWRTVEIDSDRNNEIASFKKTLDTFALFSPRVARHIYCISFNYPHFSDAIHHRTLSSCNTAIQNLIERMPKLRLMQLQGTHNQLDKLMKGVSSATLQKLDVFHMTDLGERSGSTDRLTTAHMYNCIGQMTNIRHISINSLVTDHHESIPFWTNLLQSRRFPFTLIINNPLELHGPLQESMNAPLRSLRLDHSLRNGNFESLFHILPQVASTLESLELDGYSLCPVHPFKALPLPKLQSLSLEDIYLPMERLRSVLWNWRPKKLALGRLSGADGRELQNFFKDREGLAEDVAELTLLPRSNTSFEDENDLLSLVDACVNLRIQVSYGKALESVIDAANAPTFVDGSESEGTFVYQSASDSE